MTNKKRKKETKIVTGNKSKNEQSFTEEAVFNLNAVYPIHWSSGLKLYINMVRKGDNQAVK